MYFFPMEKTVTLLLKGTSHDGGYRNKNSRKNYVPRVVIQRGMMLKSQCDQLVSMVKAAHGKIVGLAKANNGIRYANFTSLKVHDFVRV